MYSFRSRIRYSEVDRDKKLSLPALINYFQDCTTFHSESLGDGIDKVRSEGRAWVLSSWQIVIDRLPSLFEEVDICTQPYDYRGFYGDRYFYIQDMEGCKIAKANSLWIYMDINTGRPVKIPKEVSDLYGTAEPLEMEYAGRKIPMPEAEAAGEPIVVQKHQIDTNDHVNNGQYVIMAMDYLPESFKVRQLRAEYKISAKLHDVLIPYVNVTNGVYTIALCDEAKKPYAVVEFTPA